MLVSRMCMALCVCASVCGANACVCSRSCLRTPACVSVRVRVHACLCECACASVRAFPSDCIFARACVCVVNACVRRGAVHAQVLGTGVPRRYLGYLGYYCISIVSRRGLAVFIARPTTRGRPRVHLHLCPSAGVARWPQVSPGRAVRVTRRGVRATGTRP
jgi:hypothetical protein